MQSLNAHKSDIESNRFIMNSDVLFFVETWTLPEEEYNIPNFTEIHRIDGSAAI